MVGIWNNDITLAKVSGTFLVAPLYYKIFLTNCMCPEIFDQKHPNSDKVTNQNSDIVRRAGAKRKLVDSGFRVCRQCPKSPSGWHTFGVKLVNWTWAKTRSGNNILWLLHLMPLKLASIISKNTYEQSALPKWSYLDGFKLQTKTCWSYASWRHAKPSKLSPAVSSLENLALEQCS